VATIRAVCFDAFGTVVEIADKRRPFQKLLHNDYDDVSYAYEGGRLEH
jgi:hypothetical protein